ncbi:MAG: redox-regulated ATPase YchF [Candidatus Altiarchaeales archaeon]|nr:MAG: redox-regulated ATPase YchF [Candidatus Altiarchaeales archaeon]
MEIGIVGKPNVGKSTFFKALTLADVEIANFPFTTRDANIGVGYVRSECPCKEFNLKCNPINSVCIDGNRFIPVKVIDVAGLVPGAHQGKGLGNKFLDELSRADVLIHVVDISGTTDECGNPTQSHDPERDIKFLENEIDLWFFNIIKRNWSKIYSRVRYHNASLVDELADRLSGIKISESHVRISIDKADLDENGKWSDDDLMRFSEILREVSKPILIAANKIDIDKGNFERLRGKYRMIPTFSEGELALRRASESKIIRYIPGDSKFEILKEIDEKRERALEFIAGIMRRFGSTGVQECINAVVFDILKRVVVYPVENENKLSDSKGNVLPDAYLLPEGSTALDLARRIHTEIYQKFICAINCRTKKRVGRDYILRNNDIIRIITSR